MAMNGYNVTLLNIFKHGKQPNLYFLKLDGVDDTLMMDDPIDHVTMHSMSPLELLAAFADLELAVCKHAIGSNQFSHLIDYPQSFQFDLIIHDHMAGPCLLVLLDRFHYPPLLVASATNIHASLESILGTPSYPGIIPSYLFDHPASSGYFQQMYNFVITFAEQLFKLYYSNPQIDRFIQSHFEHVSSVSKLERTAIVVLMNSISFLEPANPQTWRVVNVGGLHIYPPNPRRLLPYLRENRTYDKCIYISFGSNIKMFSLMNDISHSIIMTARSMPFVNFLWKADIQHSSIDNVMPENIMISEWFPQNDLLGSGTVDIFVTHGGLLSAQEGAWHGVPMLGIPNYGDQYQNVRNIERLGIGKKLLQEHVNPFSLKHNLEDMLNDDRYKQQANIVSLIIRDQQVTPQRKALWSIEWVLRNHQRTKNMLEDLNDIGYISKYSIDVVSTLVFILILIVFVVYRVTIVCMSFMLNHLRKKNKTE
uniref:UDP-glucuronosyltransferase n=1 Tax=Anopheles farauti TaxID=69004 RepID=A0A182R038_9DIPT